LQRLRNLPLPRCAHWRRWVWNVCFVAITVTGHTCDRSTAGQPIAVCSQHVRPAAAPPECGLLLLRRRSVQSHDSERTHADGGPNGAYAPHVPQVPERTPEGGRPHRKPSPLRPQARNASVRVRIMSCASFVLALCVYFVRNAYCPRNPVATRWTGCLEDGPGSPCQLTWRGRQNPYSDEHAHCVHDRSEAADVTHLNAGRTWQRLGPRQRCSVTHLEFQHT